ncbi:MAG: TetR/AcrR family transcriptional regulator [Thermoanaerobaculia bacterium]
MRHTPDSGTPGAAPGPATGRGRRTRERILHAAAELIHARGVHATSVDDVLAAAGAGKSQFYHYFRNKEDLARQVLALQTDRQVTEQPEIYSHLDSWQGIAAWFDRIVATMEERHCVGGCPVGSMAAEVADREATLAPDLMEAFERFRTPLTRGLAAMRDRGDLRGDAEPERLADFVLAAKQGGMLLAKTYKDVAPLRRALDEALRHLRSYGPDAPTSAARDLPLPERPAGPRNRAR